MVRAKARRRTDGGIATGSAAAPFATRRSREGEPQSVTAALPGNDVHSLYEKGYGALSQNDYAGAEAAFSQLPIPRIRSPETPSTGSARATITAASTRMRPTPSSRAIRNTSPAI